MLNIVIPLSSSNSSDNNSPLNYPLPLTDFKGKALIEYVLSNINEINEPKRFIFIVDDEYCNKYHIDNMLNILVKDCSIVKLKGKTKGAVCSILMGIDNIDMNEELIIINSDQIIDCDYNKVLFDFRLKKADGGVIAFQSVHPRWSFIRILDDKVFQTAEKNPISNTAIAGFYYFKKATDFFEGAFNVIKYDDNYNGNYYTSSVYNQLILAEKNILYYLIESDKYHSFYSAQKLKEFEEYIKNKI
jgi:dTDP-glucose pyrophosphorylase